MFGGAPKCPRCGKSVYHAEEMQAAGKKYHKLCVRCKQCNKLLDSTSLSEKNEEIFCKACYGKMFGPKGYGYGGGAGTLSNTGYNVAEGKVVNESHEKKPSQSNALSSAFGGGDKCSRCSKTVYSAEKILAAGLIFHNFCCNCRQCNTRLDSTTLTEHESEIYCKACYGSLFGAKGYGYGQGAGTLNRTK